VSVTLFYYFQVFLKITVLNNVFGLFLQLRSAENKYQREQDQLELEKLRQMAAIEVSIFITTIQQLLRQFNSHDMEKFLKITV
jgi:hypothetical protein